MTYNDDRPGPGGAIAAPLDPTTPSPPDPTATPSPQDDTPGVTERASAVAGTAKDEVSKVTGEAKQQMRDLTGQTRDELNSQARQQKDRAVGGLRALSEELQSMSSDSTQSGMAGDLAQEAARRTGDFAGWLDSREPGELVDEVRTFARQRPGLFLALAAGAGVLAGRLTRGMTQAAQQDASS